MKMKTEKTRQMFYKQVVLLLDRSVCAKMQAGTSVLFTTLTSEVIKTFYFSKKPNLSDFRDKSCYTSKGILCKRNLKKK